MLQYFLQGTHNVLSNGGLELTCFDRKESHDFNHTVAAMGMRQMTDFATNGCRLYAEYAYQSIARNIKVTIIKQPPPAESFLFR